MTQASHTESTHTLPVIDRNDIELDKTQDGRYWRLRHWVGDVVLQLRISHGSSSGPDDFIAELKTYGPNAVAGRSDEGFTVLRTFMFIPAELDTEPDLGEFPVLFRDEFVAMARCWWRVLEILECGRVAAIKNTEGCAEG